MKMVGICFCARRGQIRRLRNVESRSSERRDFVLNCYVCLFFEGEEVNSCTVVRCAVEVVELEEVPGAA